MDEFQRSIKESILNADSLIIREGRFAPNERGEFVPLSYRESNNVRKAMKSMDWKASYRVYFSIPYRIEFIPMTESEAEWPTSLEPEPVRSDVFFPGGTPDTFASMFNEVTPQWTGQIVDSWLDSKLEQLDKKFEDIWSKNAPQIHDDEPITKETWTVHELMKRYPVRDISDTITIREEALKFRSARESSDFECDMAKYLAVLNLKIHTEEIGFEVHGRSFSIEVPSVSDDAERNICFFIDSRIIGLKHYVDENGCLKQSSEMNSIMKKVSTNMLITGTDICMISDVEVSILVQLDFGAGDFDSDDLQSDKNREFCTLEPKTIPFKYRVFYMNEEIYPLQAIICSLAYDQKIRTNDPVQKENVKKLESLIINENPNPLEDTNIPPELPYPGLPDGGEYQYDYDEDNLSINLRKEEYEAIQQGGEFLTTILKINRSAIDRNLSHLNIPPSQNHVILKLYEPYNEKYVDNFVSGKNLERYSFAGESFTDRSRRFLADKFNLEAECYGRISEFNKFHQSNPIRVPKTYGCGRMEFTEGSFPLASGWGLIFEYIEKDKDQTFSKEEAKHQVELLRSLGIEHNAIFWRNIIVSRGKFHLIDFSEATLKSRDEVVLSAACCREMMISLLINLCIEVIFDNWGMWGYS